MRERVNDFIDECLNNLFKTHYTEKVDQSLSVLPVMLKKIKLYRLPEFFIAMSPYKNKFSRIGFIISFFNLYLTIT